MNKIEEDFQGENLPTTTNINNTCSKGIDYDSEDEKLPTSPSSSVSSESIPIWTKIMEEFRIEEEQEKNIPLIIEVQKIFCLQKKKQKMISTTIKRRKYYLKSFLSLVLKYSELPFYKLLTFQKICGILFEP